MSISNIFTSKKIKTLLPITFVFSVIIMVKGGYEAGIWLYDVLH